MDGVVARKNNKKLEPEIEVDSSEYHVYQLGQAFKSDDLYISHGDFSGGESVEFVEEGVQGKYESFDFSFDDIEDNFVNEQHVAENEVKEEIEAEDNYNSGDVRFSLSDLRIFSQESVLLSSKISTKFAFSVGILTVTLGAFLFVGTSLAVKDRVDGAGKRAIVSMKSAMDSLSQNDFAQSGKNIDQAHEEFIFASNEIDKIGGFVTFVSQFIPGASKLSSGSHMVEAGKYLTHSMKAVHEILPQVITKDSPLAAVDGKHISFLELYRLIVEKMNVVHADIAQAKIHIDKVHLDDVPEEYRNTFLQMKEMMPSIENSLKNSLESQVAVEKLLGANGPMTYLFLFQNNHEMRATGGFIGSYGILKINNGQIEKMVVDDIFNPDGQLTDRVVPPLPIQKISADWSLHDSNWFADFSVSAKKAIDFYERTGGPTVDGVVAITPTMMEKFLQITGPITLEGYDMVLSEDNFMELMQSEVEDEENYNIEDVNENIEVADGDKAESDIIEEQEQPKQVLSDLMPIMIDKLSDRKSPEHLAKLVSAISAGLKERHIIMYTTESDIQNIIEENGWSGSVIQTDKDYLSVINTNVNGFKTDGVIDEIIKHTASIDADGYIVDTVEIKRTHRGGKTGFPWWDAVNSNYMRIYVPKGSKFIDVIGHTREINAERLNYDELGYERDRDVQKEEDKIHIDDETGTRIYDEYNKTVFANWVYVSPQESVTVKYRYRLPFKADFTSDKDGEFGSYAVLFQKQSGSEQTVVESNIVLDDKFSQVWSSEGDDEMFMKDNLKVDRYNGVVFRVR